MKFIEVANKSKGSLLSKKTGLAARSTERIVGLMFKKSIDFDGLYIKPCNSIHTFFCFFPLDVYFLDKENRVVKIIKNMRPWRLSNIYFKSRSVLEYKTGLMDGKIELHDELEVKCIN